MKRRDFLKTTGLLAAGAAISHNAIAASAVSAVPGSSDDKEGDLNGLYAPKILKADVNRTISVVIIGIGNRGKVYANYAKKFPQIMQVAGIVDNNVQRLERRGREYGVPEDRLFKSLEDFYSVPKFCDAAIISTPDDLHYEPALRVMQMGYHLLLEKPMCQTEKECRDVLEMAHKTGRIVGLCHVLRFAPYFIALRGVIKSGMIGEVVNVQHMEPIEYAHMAHSYVRGIWRDSKKSTPIILAKSCHDLDIIRYLIDKPCKSISAEGSLYLFKSDNAPEGAPMRCTDGCPHESSCPYSAIKIYCKKRAHLKHVVEAPLEVTEAEIMEALKTGQYGRCVYHCDNDQPDHYIANMVFEDGVTSSFSMDAFTPFGGRRTRIMGTMGYIEGNGHEFTAYDFTTGQKHVWNARVAEIPEYKGSGHGGGDHGALRDFLEAVCWNDPGRMTSSVDVSVESHIMGFDAEKSRKTGKRSIVKLKL